MPSEPATDDSLAVKASEVLTEAWSHPVRLRPQHVIRAAGWGRHTLVTCRVKDGPPGAPRFVVVKATNRPDQPMWREKAGLELLAEIPSLAGLAPKLYAADGDRTLLVIEELESGPTLSRLLQSKAAWAVEACHQSMAALAAVHAGTRGRRDRFVQLTGDWRGARAGSGPAALPTDPAELRHLLATAVASAGGDPTRLPVDELRTVSERMRAPESQLSLTFYDQCPPNRLIAGGRLRILDLEFVDFRHPFLDGAFPLIAHLNCMDGLRLPSWLQTQLLRTYRSGIAPAYPELVAEPRFGLEMSCACAVWMLQLLRGLPAAIERDRVVGFFLIRHRQKLLAVLDAFLGAAEAFDQLPGLRTACQQLRGRLESRWAEESEPLAHFPVFEPPATGQPPAADPPSEATRLPSRRPNGRGC